MPLGSPIVSIVRPESTARLEFETLISDLLARFLDSPDDRLDLEIVDAIRRVVEFLGLDQGILVQWWDDPSRVVPSHSWTVSGDLPISAIPQPPAVPWIHERSTAGAIVLFSNVDELPAEAEQDKAFLRSVGTRAMASLPLTLGEQVIGVLGFASQTEEIRWPDEVVRRLQLISQVFGSLLDRRKRKRDLEEQLRNERLLAEISARFVHVPAAEVDAAIEGAQRLVCEHFALDRSALFQLSDEGPDVLLLTHLYQPADGPPWQKRAASSPLSSSYWVQANTVPPTYVRLDVKATFPWIYEQLRQGNRIVLNRLDDLPAEAAIDKEAFQRYQTRSTVIVPLSIGGSWMGCLTFATMREDNRWSEEQTRRLEFVASVFANTLARRRTQQVLCESQERLQLATESADVGLWSMQPATRQLWVTGKTREIFGLASDQELTEEELFERIHSEDAASFRRALQLALQTGGDLLTDCRIVLPDRSTRCIVVRGRAHRITSGEPPCLMGVIVDITARKRTEEELQRTLQELRRLQDQLQQENLYLRQEVQARQGPTSIVGSSDALMKVLRQAEQVARTDSTVLIQGETGTGKELLAQYMHSISRRSANAFVTTNIAAIPATLLESELFGREKGAYTGALTKEIGRFELADGGTLFLDEVGEMPMETQVKLLRVLQTGGFERLGSSRSLRVDVRVIAATNRSLPELIKAGLFRQDLFYRLNVFPIMLPPLRERLEDLPLLIWSFVKELSEKMGKAFERIRKKDLEAMRTYDWPGNLRELRNVVERSMILTEGPELRLILPDGQAGDEGRSSRRLADVERQHILKVLEATGNRIRGAGGAAEVLGLKPSTLYSLMERLGIPRRR
ncbi:MAG: sigma 54-interacting transcriptional regulator [Bacillota bacterium]